MVSVKATSGPDGTVILSEMNPENAGPVALYQLSRPEAENLAREIVLASGVALNTDNMSRPVDTKVDRIFANKTLPTPTQVDHALSFLANLPRRGDFLAGTDLLATFDTATQNALINIIRHLHLDD